MQYSENLAENLQDTFSQAPLGESVQTGSIPAPTIIAEHPKMQTILKMAEVVAMHKTPVLIEGKSGTGKELLARYIHLHSERKDKPFIAVNCAAIPEQLLESELFGYEKGAFTGAVAQREGKFELAEGGTILLDEISEMPHSLQVKLLRVLQEYEVDRLGGRKPIPVNVRVIATSNRSLKSLVAENKFREDLFYRINVFPLKLPNLKDRASDMAHLVPHFISKYNTGIEKPVADDVLQKLEGHNWPGNIRELENVIARSVLLSHANESITEEHIHFDMITEKAEPDQEHVEGVNLPQGITLREMEKRLILKTLREHNGNRTHAAKTLAISVRTLRNKLNEYRKNGELTQGEI